MKRGDILPCGHTEVKLVEFGTAYTIHDRAPDGRWSHYGGEQDYTGMIEITCLECAQTWRFGNNPNRPMWAHALWDTASHPALDEVR